MLYWLLDWMNQEWGGITGFGVFKYLSFRAAIAVIFSLVISLLIGKRIINMLRRKLIGESIRDVGPESHKKKAGTPTMGGLIIIAAVVIPTLLWADLRNGYVQLILLSAIWMGFIGFLDDYIKVFKKNKAGLKGKFKILGQVGLGLIVGVTMLFHPDFRGPVGRVNDRGEVAVNTPLRSLGFQRGDKLLRVGELNFEPKNKGIEYGPVAEYTVEREIASNGTLNAIPVRLLIPEDKRQAVHDLLFEPRDEHFTTQTNVPFLKEYVFNYSRLAFWEDGDGIWGKIIYVLMVIFIVTAVSNGVNITDGIDGLAAGTSAISAAALFLFCYVSGNAIFSEYLYVSFIPKSAELTIFCAALIGGCVGFLWYNTHPAQVFMGDTGSLMLGGVIGVVAIMVKKELLLPILCGVFFLENLSVIIQVSYFKYTKRKYGEGRRVFRMSPLHHHYELGGMHEAKIVTRFWIAATMLAVLSIVTLKLR